MAEQIPIFGELSPGNLRPGPGPASAPGGPLHESSGETPASISWKEALHGEREKPYFLALMDFINQELAEGRTIYPEKQNVFNALLLTPFQDVRVVILGQDPYHGPRQAHGLCFSVQRGIHPPPSLVNIFKEISADLGLARPSHGCLEAWARQGVLLLNSVLTVESGKPGSHANRGWEQFTDRIISELNQKKAGLVFLLWGAYAHKKGAIIDSRRHCVISSPHPSPFSADRGFFGSRPFSRANDYLARTGGSAIDWQL